MLVQTHYPRQLSRSRYDQYLASGWFRGAVMLYKMDLVCIDNEVYSVVNIRLNLENYKASKSQRKILRNAERRFKILYGKANPTPEKEELYKQHKHRFKGFIHPTLIDYLNAGFDSTVFDTREVCVYDGDRLVAVSYFDLGEKAMASLLGLYDEAYSDWSLGTLTMLKEIEFGIKTDRKLYYPGYTLDMPTEFDYKIKLGDMEYYTPKRRWANYSGFNPSDSVAALLRSSTQKLSDALTREGVPHKNWLYPYFSMGYVGPWNSFFLRAPAPIEIGHDHSGMMIASYSHEENAYSLYRINPCPDGAQFLQMEASKEFINSEVYLNHLYQTTDPLVKHCSMDIVLDQIKRWRKHSEYLPPE